MAFFTLAGGHTTVARGSPGAKAAASIAQARKSSAAQQQRSKRRGVSALATAQSPDETQFASF
jgi:hypothetical protein